MDRAAWQRLSRLRQREARVLLDAGEFAGAYYLCGYAVECALKACIVRALPARTMPERKDVQAFYTHDLEQLLALTALKPGLMADATRRTNWFTVKDWSEQARYRDDITTGQAHDLYRACTAAKIGVLPWLRKSW